MWVAKYLICILPLFECVEIEETEQKYFFKEAECEKHAIAFSMNLQKRMLDKGHAVQVGYLCEEDKMIKGTNAT